jgi:hypothetical protein
MKSFIVLSALFISTASFAQIPAGSFSGFVSNNSFQDLCNLNHADIEFVTQDNGYQVRWEESGFWQAPMSGFCQHNFDATFTATGNANEWNVSFNNNWDMSFGKAVLQNGVLTVTANYTGSNASFLRFNTKMKFNADQSGFNYSRVIDRWSGPSLYANGSLNK